MNLTNLSNQVNYSSDKIQSAIIHQSKDTKCILLAFSAGQELKSHITPHDVLLIMVEGSCKFIMNDDEQTLSAGQVITIPAVVPHAVIAQTDFKMILVK